MVCLLANLVERFVQYQRAGPARKHRELMKLLLDGLLQIELPDGPQKSQKLTSHSSLAEQLVSSLTCVSTHTVRGNTTVEQRLLLGIYFC